MRRHRLVATFGLCVSLVSGAVVTAEPVDLLPLLTQAPPSTPPAPPATPPATPPTTPPSTTPPGLTTPPALAPVTNTAGAAPQSLASSGAGFTPYMMGDLPATSFVRGQVCYPGLVPFIIPPVIVTTPPQRINIDGVITIIPGRTVVVTPAQVVLRPGVVCQNILIPQVCRGGVKIEEDESPRPVDRVYFAYNYFDDITHAFPGVPRSNLSREMYGFELTFLNGDASIGLRMNSLQTTGDTTLSNDIFGDLTVITKYAFINNRETGNVLSGGLAITAPTGSCSRLPDGTMLNPTLLQPYAGFIYNWERLYAQGFSSLIIPTDSRDALVGTASLSFGYWLYRSSDPSAFLGYIVPAVEGHSTFAFDHRGLNQTLTGFPDVFELTNGLHIGLGRANLALGVGVPLTGPKVFGIEALAQLNWRF
jgi:hypothetical protein